MGVRGWGVGVRRRGVGVRGWGVNVRGWDVGVRLLSLVLRWKRRSVRDSSVLSIEPEIL